MVHPGNVMERMLGVNLKNEARNLLTAARPTSDKLFSGDNTNVDFETFMARFERMTAIEGVDDRMRLVELPHYVTGTAAVIVSSYEDIADASAALKQIKAHLKRDFGRRVYTARQLLEQLLKGPVLSKDKPSEIRAFLIKLEQAYRRGIETKREVLFSNPELINEIIRRKLPFVSEKWSSKIYDRDEKMATDEEVTELNFADFLSFVRRLNGCKLHERAIMSKPQSSDNISNFPSHPSNRPPSRFPRLAPVVASPTLDETPGEDGDSADLTGVSIAASSSSAPKTKTSAQKKKKSPASGTSPTPSKCPLCPINHGVYRCKSFLSADVEERIRIVRTNHLCKLCLNPGHYADQCPLNFSCKECAGPHNSLLHVYQDGPHAPSTPVSQF